ncbi:hypothetical protein PIB30_049112 [Stylosanthes scabra]|uniref:Uncharacterized protein n=1 Tax=Stylosanthes scabra TaxID=79078 RepID=A0ABU6TH07_9FABA|nr:hypothetical protein [Stylosanthes scabra]
MVLVARDNHNISNMASSGKAELKGNSHRWCTPATLVAVWVIRGGAVPMQTSNYHHPTMFPPCWSSCSRFPFLFPAVKGGDDTTQRLVTLGKRFNGGTHAVAAEPTSSSLFISLTTATALNVMAAENGDDKVHNGDVGFVNDGGGEKPLSLVDSFFSASVSLSSRTDGGGCGDGR